MSAKPKTSQDPTSPRPRAIQGLSGEAWRKVSDLGADPTGLDHVAGTCFLLTIRV